MNNDTGVEWWLSSDPHKVVYAGSTPASGTMEDLEKTVQEVQERILALKAKMLEPQHANMFFDHQQLETVVLLAELAAALFEIAVAVKDLKNK